MKGVIKIIDNAVSGFRADLFVDAIGIGIGIGTSNYWHYGETDWHFEWDYLPDDWRRRRKGLPPLSFASMLAAER